MDFINDVPSAVTLASAVWNAVDIDGHDQTPAARLIGPASVSGTKTQQYVANLLVGSHYRLEAVATGSDGLIYILWSYIASINPSP
jgi:hypothetical protein